MKEPRISMTTWKPGDRVTAKIRGQSYSAVLYRKASDTQWEVCVNRMLYTVDNSYIEMQMPTEFAVGKNVLVERVTYGEISGFSMPGANGNRWEIALDHGHSGVFDESDLTLVRPEIQRRRLPPAPRHVSSRSVGSHLEALDKLTDICQHLSFQ